MRLALVTLSVILAGIWSLALVFGVVASGLTVFDFAFGTSSSMWAAAITITYIVIVIVIMMIPVAVTKFWKLWYDSWVQWIVFFVIPQLLVPAAFWTLRAEVVERIQQGHVARVIVASLLVSFVMWLLQRCVDTLNQRPALRYFLPRAVQLAEEFAVAANPDAMHRNSMKALRKVVANSTQRILTCDDTKELHRREKHRTSSVDIPSQNLREELFEEAERVRDVYEVLLERGALND